MTLCVAWLRKTNDKSEEELVLATDSCLSGGERWNTGIKLFDFQRKDCLIAFAGETYRAYPLIMNAIHLIKTNPNLANPYTSLETIKDELCNLFTELTNGIYNHGTQQIESLKSEAKFIFGGWDYLTQSFLLWNIYYVHKVQKFFNEPVYFDDANPAFFMGDSEEEALSLLHKKLEAFQKTENINLDMEPFQTLRDIIINEINDSVAGSIQLAKVYRSGTNEFFGVYWPSSEGRPNLHGQDYEHHSRPNVRYIDPDTASIILEDLPSNFEYFENDEKIKSYSEKYKPFIEKCYPANKLSDELNSIEREKLTYLLKNITYKKFLHDIKLSEKDSNDEDDFPSDSNPT
ncbi:MAG: hypothetical protein IPH62_09665 [Ignavibacteriae bacterium]|nr:hypothetical protein [Ignavibacteriota bacterium]